MPSSRISTHNILVTGGSGFLGENVVRSLGKEFSLHVPSHRQLDMANTDAVGAYIKQHNIKTIIHCANAPREGSMELTIRMFLSIVEHSKDLDQIIYFGSGAEYDKMQDLIRVKETDFGRRIPKDGYGLSKYLISLMAQKEKNITIFRPFGLYGPGEDYRIKFISNSIVKLLSGMPLIIRQDTVFDYLYIDDLISLIRLALLHRIPHGVYNATPDASISLREITKIICQVANKPHEVTVLEKHMNYQYTGDNHRLKKALPTFRFHGYQEGIEKLFRYYKKRVNAIDIKAIKKDEYRKRCIVRKKS